MGARLTMLICLIAAFCYAGYAFMQTKEADESRQQTDAASVRATGLIDSAPKHLAAGFTDEHRMLLADPPQDPSKFVDPQAFVVGHLQESDPDSPMVDWAEFDKHLSEATGRKVTDVEVENGPSQIDKIKKGEINIMALHGPDVPFLVNNCGYQPIAVLSDDKGVEGNRLDLMVSAKSTLQHPSELAGKTLTCTGPLSIVGYRAAIVLLMQKEHLRPNVDYYLAWSLGQKQSIKGVADGTYEVAAVSDEKLRAQVAKGSIKESSYRIIYQSDVFPRMTMGYFYNLKPELADKVRQAVLSYKPAGADEKPLHFTPLDYKKDFALVRNIDDQFDPRLEPKSKHDDSTTAPVALR